MTGFNDLTENRVCMPELLRNFPKRKLENGVWKRDFGNGIAQKKITGSTFLKKLLRLLGA